MYQSKPSAGITISDVSKKNSDQSPPSQSTRLPPKETIEVRPKLPTEANRAYWLAEKATPVKAERNETKATIEKASQLYLKRGNQAKATLEHQINLAGLTLVESWIKVDMEKDKSAAYGLNDVVGTWYVAMKVDNDEIWNEYVKTGRVKGFSIEGFFADKSTEMAKMSKDEVILAKLKELLSNIEQ